MKMRFHSKNTKSYYISTISTICGQYSDPPGVFSLWLPGSLSMFVSLSLSLSQNHTHTHTSRPASVGLSYLPLVELLRAPPRGLELRLMRVLVHFHLPPHLGQLILLQGSDYAVDENPLSHHHITSSHHHIYRTMSDQRSTINKDET